jgi:filamentous hemagglutinin
MTRVYLIGFCGTGFADTYEHEPALVQSGHVDFAFEGDDRIFGFHPTPMAVQTIGSDQAVIEWLKALNTLPGTLQVDNTAFERAYALSQAGGRTTVWQMAIDLLESEFQQIYTQVLQWYTEQVEFRYSFPAETPMDDRDNCATFPRRLGLPLPETSGQLRVYIPALAERGSKWHPKENT